MSAATPKDKYVEAIGRRKTATARVRITPAGKTVFTVNSKPLKEYFALPALSQVAEAPLKKVKMDGFLNVSAKTVGGGIAAQATAVAHGLARAISKKDGTLRGTLKKAKLLTRDSRMKERRKFGLKKARKSPQWSKR